MADDTATYDPATDELMTEAEAAAPDEVTPEDHLDKMKLALLANEAMRREEAALDERSGWSPAPSPMAAPGGQWQPSSGVALGGPSVAPPVLPPGAAPTLINRGGQAFAGTPLPQPTGQGRMYMGPTMSPDQESSFMLSPPGTRTNLMPPPQITAPESYESRLSQAQAADQPGTRTISIARPQGRLTPNDIAWTSAYEQWAAQQDLKAAIARGVPEDKASAMFPAAYASTSRMTAGQEANLTEKKREFDERQKAAAESGTPKISKIDDQHSLIQVSGSKKWQMIDNTTGDIKPLTPKQAADLLTKITAEEQSTRKPTALSAMKDDLADIVQSGVTGAKGKKPKGSSSAIPKAHIDFLKKNPSYAASFDRRYGQGSAQKILNP